MLTDYNRNITLLRVFIVLIYYVKLFRAGANRHNGILISLLLLLTEAINCYVIIGLKFFVTNRIK